MPRILIFHEDDHMGTSFEHQIKGFLSEESVEKVSNIKLLLTSVTENTKLILLNYSGREAVMEDIMSTIKTINNKISIIISTCFGKGDIPSNIEDKADEILYCPYNVRYIDIIKEHLN